LNGLQHLGDWRLVRRIRQTRSGGVHWQTANGFLLVELPSEIVEAPAMARAFSRYVEAFAAIFRPDIARVVDWTSVGECAFVVLEVPTSATLRELEDRTLLPPDVRARIALDALEAVGAAHASSAVFGDLDADSVIVSEQGQVVLLPTCSRASAATPADDIAALAKLAGIPHFQQTAHTLGNRLRALGAVAHRETVARFVSGIFLDSVRPPRTSQPPARAFIPSISDDDLTPVRLVDLDRVRMRAISELSPDDLIPVGTSDPQIPVHIDEAPAPRNTERPVVSEPKIVDVHARPAERSPRLTLGRMAALLAACAAVGAAGAIWWQSPPAWLRPVVVALERTLRPAAPTLPVGEPATAAQPRTVAAAPTVAAASPPTVASASPPGVSPAPPATAPTAPPTAETAQAAPPSRAVAPAKRTAPRWRAKRATARRRTADEGAKARESSGYKFLPKEL